MAKFSEERPGAGREWYKAHGLGNDYLVVEEGGDWTVSAEAVQRVCDRTRGVGSDGIVALLGGRGEARGSGERPFRLRMFNPDGGEFERSGNGLRILASYLHQGDLVRSGAPFFVEVGGDRVRLEVHGRDGRGVYDVSAEMGRASVDPADVGLVQGALDEEGALDVPGVGSVALHTVSVGNPHAVVFAHSRGEGGPRSLLVELDVGTLHRLGPRIATHPAFAHGTNVQLARGAGEGVVEALIWERGVGETSASGTSACAVAVAAVQAGVVPAGEVEVRMEGGSLHVHVSESLDVVLRGPVQEVSTGALTDGFLAWLGG